VALNLLEGHLAHCVAEAQTSGDPTAAQAKVKEASDAVARLLRT
jgi:DNA-binding FrmR family transcriptional regulator